MNGISSIGNLNSLNRTTTNVNNLIKTIATGSKVPSVNFASSDYSITTRMNSNVKAYEQYSRNIQNTKALSKTASSALENTISNLSSLRETLLSAKNGTNTKEDLATMQKSVDNTLAQINENAGITFNGKQIFGETFNTADYNNTSVTFNKIDTDTLGISGINLNDSASIDSALENIDSALESTNGALSAATDIGSVENSLDFAYNNVNSQIENLYESISTMSDTDIAESITKLKSEQTIQQLALQAQSMYMHNNYSVLKLLN